MSGKQKISAYISDTLHRQLKVRSAVNGETMSSMAQAALESFLVTDLSENQLSELDTLSDDNERQKITLYLSETLYEQLTLKAADSDRTISQLFAPALSQYLSKGTRNSSVQEYSSSEKSITQTSDSEKKEPESIEICINVPDNFPPEKLREVIRKTALSADSLHRANGGKGLQVDLVKIYEEAFVPEGLRR